MPIDFECPSCGRVFRLGDETAGKLATCRCGKSLTVPASVQEPDTQCDELIDLPEEAVGIGRTEGDTMNQVKFAYERIIELLIEIKVQDAITSQRVMDMSSIVHNLQSRADSIERRLAEIQFEQFKSRLE
jgi:hypothetical protein